MNEKKSDSEKISITANITAYAWEELQIENASYFVDEKFRKIFSLIRFFGYPLFISKKNDYTYFMLEPRHRAIEHFMLTKFPNRQILELASGLSPRGMTFSGDAEITYIEADLPKMIKSKKEKVLDIYQKKGIKRDNHKFVEIDLLNDRIFEKVSPFIDPSKPVTVITEGLTPYFDMEQLKIIFSNIQQFLKKNSGGVYITDIYHVEDLQKSLLHKGIIENFLKLLGTGFRNDIDNLAEGEAFMRECGFDFVETINPLEFSRQLGLKANIPPEKGVVTIYIAHVF